nr:hypothetical protein [Chromobacterium sp. ASV5]
MITGISSSFPAQLAERLTPGRPVPPLAAAAGKTAAAAALVSRPVAVAAASDNARLDQSAMAIYQYQTATKTLDTYLQTGGAGSQLDVTA